MMKKPIQSMVFMICALALYSCSSPFLERPRAFSGGEAAAADIPEGHGAVRIDFFRGAARTVIPPMDLENFYGEFWFTKAGGTAQKKDPVDDKFMLEPGSYSLTVKFFADSAFQKLVAEGTTDTNFTVPAGEMITTHITLRPIASGEGTGTLNFGLQYPAGVTIDTFTLTRIAGDESYDLKTAGSAAGENPVSFGGTKAEIPVGYYLLRVILRDSAGALTGRTEVVHIYQNLTAGTELAGYTFSAADFIAYRVTTANNEGPGSLRQALIDTPAGQAIRVMLEPGSVIELQSALPAITKSVTLEGNGVTLTWAASWTASSATSQLLYINSSTAEVTIRGVHFKDGLASDFGGAVRNTGTLTLESCIFSGNGTIVSDAWGGAVYSSNTLTIRGCTFFYNTSAYYGGAVYLQGSGKTLTLTGNVFYGNTASSYPVVRNNSGTVSASYNVADVALGTGTAQSGWAAGTGDGYSTALPVSPGTFKVVAGGPAANKLPGTLPAEYPAADFYGQPISGGGAAGAVQGVQ
jgi:hypothetical protein